MTVPTRFVTSLVIALALSGVCAAQCPPGRALSDYLHASEKFGRKLLLATHEAEPETNVALSPFPVFQAFGALSEGTNDWTNSAELDNVFEWKNQPFRNIASRMLTARIPSEGFPPKKQLQTHEPAKPPPVIPLPTEPFVPLSQSTVFLFKGKGLIRPRFIEVASRDYGIQFQEAKPGEPPVPGDPAVRKLYESYRSEEGILDFSITTFTDLRTAWRRESFRERSQKLPFTLRTGAKVEVDQMVSEPQLYRHVSTEDFEAVELPCGEAYLLVLMPAVGKGILELERQFASEKFDLNAMLKSELGDVTLPILHIQFTKDLQPPLRRLGLNNIFVDFRSLGGMVGTLEGARLTTALQRVDLDVDTWGIKARAITFLGGVAGGVMGGSMAPLPTPFHMIVNRPFLFFIRDNVTDALLFAGVEMNPTVR